MIQSSHPNRDNRNRQTLVIDRVGGQGDGICGEIFVPLALAGEQVDVAIDGARGEIINLLSASPERVTPACAHFGDCGGCALQHWAGAPYLDWKVEQLRQTLAREGIETELLAPFAAPAGSRRRLALHARRQGGRIILGFKARKSWRVVDVQHCPVALPALNTALPALRRLAEPLFQHAKSAPTLHVTATDTGLDIDISGVERRMDGGLSADGRLRLAQAAQAMDAARVTLAGEVVYGARPPRVTVGPVQVVHPAGGFLQASAAAEAAMADFVGEALRGASRLADLYCGVGAFTFRLAKGASVRAADSSAGAVAALIQAVGTAPGLKAIQAEVRDLARRPMLAGEVSKLDGVVIDPPRAGAKEQCRELGSSRLARLAYVSCNPQTFARDARGLIDAGFRLERILPVDQFLWSSHIELVGIFIR